MRGSASRSKSAFQPAARIRAARLSHVVSPVRSRWDSEKCARIGRLSQVSHLSHLI